MLASVVSCATAIQGSVQAPAVFECGEATREQAERQGLSRREIWQQRAQLRSQTEECVSRLAPAQRTMSLRSEPAGPAIAPLVHETSEPIPVVLLGEQDGWHRVKKDSGLEGSVSENDAVVFVRMH